MSFVYLIFWFGYSIIELAKGFSMDPKFSNLDSFELLVALGIGGIIILLDTINKRMENNTDVN